MDRTYLEKEIESHWNWLYAIARKRLRNSQDAEDVTQQVIIKSLLACEQVRDQMLLRHWLRRNLLNACIDFARKQKSRKRWLGKAIVLDTGEWNVDRAAANFNELGRFEDLDEFRAFLADCEDCLTKEEWDLLWISTDLTPSEMAEGFGGTGRSMSARLSYLRAKARNLERPRQIWRQGSKHLIRASYYVRPSPTDPAELIDAVCLRKGFERLGNHDVFKTSIFGACAQLVRRCGPGSIIKTFPIIPAHLTADRISCLRSVLYQYVQSGVTVACLPWKNDQPLAALDYFPRLACGFGQHYNLEQSAYLELYPAVGLERPRSENRMIDWVSAFVGATQDASHVFPYAIYDPKQHNRMVEEVKATTNRGIRIHHVAQIADVLLELCRNAGVPSPDGGNDGEQRHDVVS